MSAQLPCELLQLMGPQSNRRCIDPVEERKWYRSQPRLRCAGGRWLFQRRKMGGFSIYSQLCLVILVLQTEAKGIISGAQTLPEKLYPEPVNENSN